MFKKDYSWIDDYIESAEKQGRVLVATALKESKKEIEKLSEENIKLKIELSKYKGRKKKI